MERFEKRRWFLFLADILLVNLALWLAFALRFEWAIPEVYRPYYWQIAVFVTLLRITLLALLGLYRGVWRYIGISDLMAILKAVSLGTVMMAASAFLARRLDYASWGLPLEWLEGYPLSVMVAEWLGAIILIGGLRLGLRLLQRHRVITRYRHLERKRVLIIGAGDAGEMVARQLLAHPEFGYQPVGFIDDDPRKQNRRIHGLPIIAGRDQIFQVVLERRVEEIIIAIPSAPGSVVRELVEQCRRAKLKFKIVPGIKDIIEGEVSLSQIREVELEDLLGRQPVSLNMDEISGYLTGKRVLVSGAGGSIGAELCRQIAGLGPERLVMLGKGENSLYEIEYELTHRFKGLPLIAAVGDVGDRARMEQIFGEYRPQVVFHAAAHKHVPLMEANPGEAVKNNVFGTKTLAEASIAAGVERFVFISTDKAVNPTSIMGATKRLAEDVLSALEAKGRTKFITVRFGNVLGSRGSVVPLFKRQIAAGGPVTVTHPEVERYFMTIPEAVQLVIQAGAMGRGGEIFVLDMGKPVKIVDLARDLIILSGLEPETDISIEFTGLRPGEKLYEELMTAEEGVNATRHSQIFVARARRFQPGQLDKILKRLENASRRGHHRQIVSALKSCLPSYRPSEK
jgi:FlaA1/EpsC-like NDP-sugar epimerase